MNVVPFPRQHRTAVQRLLDDLGSAMLAAVRLMLGVLLVIAVLVVALLSALLHSIPER